MLLLDYRAVHLLLAYISHGKLCVDVTNDILLSLDLHPVREDKQLI